MTRFKLQYLYFLYSDKFAQTSLYSVNKRQQTTAACESRQLTNFTNFIYKFRIRARIIEQTQTVYKKVVKK